MRNKVPVGPPGVDEPEIVGASSDWKRVSAETDNGPGPVGPLGNVPQRWYRLLRR